MKMRALIVALFALVSSNMALAGGGAGGDPTASAGEIKVATRVVPPLVVDDGSGKLSGFSIELWEGIAERLSLRTTWTVTPDVKALLESVGSGATDLGIAAISITAERDRLYDFSLPILDSGLQILLRGSAEGGENPLEGFLRLLFSPTLYVWLAIAAVLIIIPAHLIWFLERRHNEGIVPKDAGYLPGIFHAMWWAASTLATQAEQMPRHWLARVLALLWMFVGVVFVAYYTAQLTAQLTVQEIRGAIAGPNDLPGKKVATTKGSTAAAWLKQQKSIVTEVEAIADAYAALKAGAVDAVVFDSPVLLSYAAKDGQGHVRVVGPVFRKENYGIAFKPGSELRRKVDAELLSMREDGSYDKIYDKWFTSK